MGFEATFFSFILEAIYILYFTSQSFTHNLKIISTGSLNLALLILGLGFIETFSSSVNFLIFDSQRFNKIDFCIFNATFTHNFIFHKRE